MKTITAGYTKFLTGPIRFANPGPARVLWSGFVVRFGASGAEQGET